MSHYQGSVPDALTRTGQWAKQAACIGRANLMHPDNDEHEIAAAKAICTRCPVARECFWDAVATGDMKHGIRAGLRANERRAVAKELEQRAADRAAADTLEPPRPETPRQPRPANLTEAVARRTNATEDGHARWQGIAHLQFRGQRYTALQAVFIVGHGREPQGLVRRTCNNANCVRADHLADEVIRESDARCGTRDGYRWHRKRGEDACSPCKRANTDADNRLRRTGTTKAAA